MRKKNKQVDTIKKIVLKPPVIRPDKIKKVSTKTKTPKQ